MILSREADGARHPYWYAWIIRIFYINVWDYRDASMTKLH